MFEGDFADMCAEKYLLVSMGAWAEGLAFTDPGASAPIGGSGNFTVFFPMIVHSILKDFVSILKQSPSLPPHCAHPFVCQSLNASLCDRKFLSVIRGFLPWQEVSSWHWKFLPVTESLFLYQEVSSIEFSSREYSIFATKCGNSTTHFVWGLKNLCHLGCWDARKNPTLIGSILIYDTN